MISPQLKFGVKWAFSVLYYVWSWIKGTNLFCITLFKRSAFLRTLFWGCIRFHVHKCRRLLAWTFSELSKRIEPSQEKKSKRQRAKQEKVLTLPKTDPFQILQNIHNSFIHNSSILFNLTKSTFLAADSFQNSDYALFVCLVFETVLASCTSNSSLFAWPCFFH